MKKCCDCGRDRDSYCFTNDDEVCDYCWALNGGD